ncbi:hypothetical protein HK405_003369, partial [Cladochytrium tenue]
MAGSTVGGALALVITKKSRAAKLFLKSKASLSAAGGMSALAAILGGGGISPSSTSPTAGTEKPAAAVSTGTRDAGVGLPTFATLTSSVTIKAAAESCLAQFSNYFGNFPPASSGDGVSKLSTLFDELKEAERIVGLRNRLSGPEGTGTTTGMGELGQYLRYFSYDDQVILGFLEQP